jgi:ABC-2 type transport system permease protein
MLSNIFLKTVYERRWAILWWSLAIFAMTLLTVTLFPTFSKAFGESLKDVPDSLKNVLGEAHDYQRIEGFLQLQVYTQMIFLPIIYGIIMGTGLIAGEEGQGTLQSVLAHPVSRTRVYLQKFAAAAVVLWVINMAMFLAIFVGCQLIGESPDYARVLMATDMQWLVSLVFAAVGYALGAATGRRALAGALTGVYVFVMYLVSSLVATVDWMRYPNYFSPFKYFSEPRIMDAGLQWDNVSVLAIAGLVLLAAGWAVFNKRDIFSR